MKKYLVIIIFVIIFIGLIIYFRKPDLKNTPNNEETYQLEGDDVMQITIANQTYTLNLLDNATTQALIKLLPLDIEMQELNGNEKYYYLPDSLPTAAYRPQEIKRGDVMLYQDNCLVIFYQDFTTNYSYTPIGHIEELPQLSKENIRASIFITKEQ